MSNNTTPVRSQWRHSLCVAMLLSSVEIAGHLVVLGVRKLTRRAVTVEALRTELEKVAAKRLRAQKQAFSPSFGSALYKPSRKLEALKAREESLKSALAAAGGK